MLHPVTAQAGSFPSPQGVIAMAFCAVVPKHSAAGSDGVGLSSQRIYALPIRFRHVIQPAPIRSQTDNRRSQHSSHQYRFVDSHLRSPN
jgi:hypothetical protein